MKVIFKAIHSQSHTSKLFDYNFMVRTQNLIKVETSLHEPVHMFSVYGIYNRSKNPKYLELFYVVAT